MKTKFAAERLHHLYADLKEIGEIGIEIQKEAFDPHLVRTLANKIERLRLAVVAQLHDGIEPLLERQAPQLEKRVAALEEKVKLLENTKVIALEERRRA